MSLNRVLIIHNPTSGGRRRRRLDAALAAFSRARVAVEVARTQEPAHAERLAREADDGFDAVIAAGGDGTAHEVANGLLARARPLPFGLLPFGTANCLARELGSAGDPARAAARLVDAPVRLMTPGEVEIDGRTRYFLSMLGAGFDARVVGRLGRRLKRRLGIVAYVLESLKMWAEGPVRPVAVTVDGTTSRVGQAVVANGRYYGGWMRFAPTATVFRPSLFVCLFRSTDRPRVLRYCFWSVFGRLHRLADYAVIPARAITVAPAGAGAESVPEPVQADGETIGHLPIVVRPAGRRLPVLVPDDPFAQRFGPPPVP